MSRLPLCLGALMLSACAVVPLDYSGKDAGTVVIGFGVASKPRAFDFYKIVIARAEDARACREARTSNLVDYASHSLLTHRSDYTSAYEEGVVVSASLVPGDYAICDYKLTYVGAEGNYTLSPTRTLWLPFTVVAGKTLYLGNLQANTLLGRGMREGTEVPTGVAFIVTDRIRQDIALARARAPVLPADVMDGTLDVKTHRAASFWTPQMLQEHG